MAIQRRTNAAKAVKMTAAVILIIEEKIRLDWSPEQISGWLKVHKGIAISHERIYQHIWNDKLQGGVFINICAKVTKSEKSNMVQRISVGKSEIVSVLMNDQSLSKKNSV
jgi:IS30 family transposase